MSEDPFQVGRIDYPELLELVPAAMAAKADLINEWEAHYTARRIARGSYQPVPAWLGHARAGKDEAGEWLGKHSNLAYGGSNSKVLLPFIAWARKEPEEKAWAERHANNRYWFQFGNLLRKHDVTSIARWSMAKADMVVGIRALPELQACLRDRVITHAIWVNNPRVEKDPTVEFSVQDCGYIVDNTGSLAEYHATLANFCNSIGIQTKE